MARKHYHVISGMGGGYSPNNNVYCETRKEAASYALDLAERWREMSAEVADVTPEAYRDVVTGSARKGIYILSQPNNPYHPGEYIEIVPCSDDCESEDFD